MRKLFLHIVSLFCITVVSSQPVFNKVYDYNQDYEALSPLIESYDGNYISAGQTRSLINNEMSTYVVKINNNGDLVWEKKYNLINDNFETIIDIYQYDSLLYLIGNYPDSSLSFDPNSFFLILDEDGDSLDFLNYADTIVNASTKILLINDKFYILQWNKEITPPHINFSKIIITDLTGNIINDWVFYGNGPNAYQDFKLTEDGFILAGSSYSDSLNSNLDFQFLKIDTLGNILWEMTYGTSNDEFTRNHNYLALTQDGGYVMCGEEDVGGLTNHQGVVLKVDSNGQMLWRKNVSEGEYTVCLSIREWQDGSLIVASNFTNYDSIIPFFNDPRGHLMKLSADGDSVIWERTFSKWNLDANNNPSGVSSDDYVHGMILTSDGGILVSGYQIHPKITNNDGWLIKFDSCGYSVGAQPQASFTIDSVIGNQVYISNLSEEYCIANMQISLIHSLQNDTSLLDSIHIYAYSPFTNGDDPTQLVYTIPDTGIYLFQLTTFAGDTFDIFTSSINVADTSTSIGGIQNNLVFNIFPNPTKNNIIVQLSASSPTASYGEIYAIDGRKVHDFTISANLLQTKIELPELQTGVYLVKINDDSGRSAMERITIL